MPPVWFIGQEDGVEKVVVFGGGWWELRLDVRAACAVRAFGKHTTTTTTTRCIKVSLAVAMLRVSRLASLNNI